jgi:hypothetical protein
MVMAAIGGCGKAYVAPTSQATVQVDLANETGIHLSAHYFAGAEKCTEPQSIGSFINTGETRAIRVAADRPATLVFQRLGLSQGFAGLTVHSCILAISFRPNIGSAYTVELTSDDKRCYLDLKETKNGNSTLYKFVKRTYRTPFFKSQGFCARLTGAERRSLMGG